MSRKIIATKSAKELADDHKIKLKDIENPDNLEITAEMVESHIAKLDGKQPGEDEQPEEPKDYKDTKRVKQALVCRFTIKEEGKTFKPGEEYTGKNKDYLSKKGSIVRKYKEV